MLSDALPKQSESTTVRCDLSNLIISLSAIFLRFQPLHMKKIINDALYLRDIHELSLLNVPIQPSKTWSSIPGTSLDLDASHNVPYHVLFH